MRPLLLLLLLAVAATTTAATATVRRAHHHHAATSNRQRPLLPASPAHVPHLRPLADVRHDNVRVDPTTDCAIKQLAWEYAVKLQGDTQPAVSTLVHEALELGAVCELPQPEDQQYSEFFPTQLKWRQQANGKEARTAQTAPALTLFVDATGGAGANPGTQASPVLSLQQALRIIRFSRPVNGPIADLAPATIFMRRGMYFFDSTVEMNTRDSFITIAAFEGEEVVFSGGVDLSSLPFKHWKGSVFVASLPPKMHITTDAFNELYVRGRRGVRARYPNGNSETHGMWTVGKTGYVTKAESWLPVFPRGKPVDIKITSPVRKSKSFPNYLLGVGGPAEVFSPPSSFWCAEHPPAGSTFMVPSGFVYDASTWMNRTHSTPGQAFVHTFHSFFWGSWSFAVQSIDTEKRTVKFSHGGYQEARGTLAGANWYIENLLEELDSPEEWFVDASNSLLYYMPNSTDSFKRGSDGFMYFQGEPGSLVASQTPVILSVQGSSSSSLVEGVSIERITFAHASSTFMAPMEVPSAGDWAITRLAALRLEYVRNATVSECVFNGVGGNALVVSRTAWNTSIVGNEFVWLGSSAIIVAGEVNGMDGSSEVTYPIGTIIRGNLMHELGIWVKQSSGVGQSLAQATTIDSNIIFNAPRAAINQNDGFGGGHVISNNLLFNSVRETDDHGLFNSWDRQPFLQRRADGTVSLIPDQNEITRNFLIGNYHSVWNIDHDDGSAYYTDSFNYVYLSGYKSYLGNSLNVVQNIYILPDGKVDVHKELTQAQQTRKRGIRRRGSEAVNPLGGLSSIMQARERNMDHRYRIDKRQWEERDQKQAEERTLSRNWGQFCCQDGGGYDHLWANNTCAVLAVADIYNLWMCDLADLPNSIPFLAANRLYAAGDIQVTCNTATFTLPEFQKLGYDLLTQQYPPATLGQMLDWGRELFQLGTFGESAKPQKIALF